jgi:hypothetical protein
MAAGTPIRLVQQNGNTIELDATTMVLSTSRKVGGMALPFTGSKRIGMDLNINKAMINIQGIIADDREGTKAKAHSATINFGRDKNGNQWNTTYNLQDINTGFRLKLQTFSSSTTAAWKVIYITRAEDTTSDGVTASGATTMNLTNASTFSTSGNGTINGDAFTWTGKSATNTNQLTGVSGVGSEKSDNVVVKQTSTEADVLSAGRIVTHTTFIPTQLVAALVTYINTNFVSDFTASAVSGKDYNNTTSNCILSIVMNTAGRETGMHLYTPSFAGLTNMIPPEKQASFAGGVDRSLKSAGDKAMDLYGIINNSKHRGLVSDIVNYNLESSDGIKKGRGHELKDYIMGIQIPYNSMLKATGGDQYVARNFFMPTGNYDGLDKTSFANDHPASVEMNFSDETQGIQGAVQKFDITYDAGESVYNFNMIFAPIDNMILS